MSGLHAHGIRIPEDLSIVGFDNMAISTQTFPPMTTISQDLELKAQLAVDILRNQLKNSVSSAESRILDVKLIERESVLKR